MLTRRLRDLLARVVTCREALEDGDRPYLAALLCDLEVDFVTLIQRTEAAIQRIERVA